MLLLLLSKKRPHAAEVVAAVAAVVVEVSVAVVGVAVAVEVSAVAVVVVVDRVIYDTQETEAVSGEVTGVVLVGLIEAVLAELIKVGAEVVLEEEPVQVNEMYDRIKEIKKGQEMLALDNVMYARAKELKTGETETVAIETRIERTGKII